MDAKTLCLAVLASGDASGYEIKKTLEEAPYSHFQETGFGSIYPALTKLTEEGLANCRELAQAKRPDKKVYSLTPKGERALFEALIAEPAPDKYRSDLLFVLFHGHLLPADHVARVVDERLQHYEARIAHMEGCDLSADSPGRRFVHGFGLALYRAAAQYLRDNREMAIAGAADAGKMVAE